MASQQPPARPWFRFGTMTARSAAVPSTTPQPDPVLQPRPRTIQPTFWATTLPTQTQEPAPVAAPAPPVATNQVPPAPAAPITISAPNAPAPAPIQQTPASAPAPPRSPNTTVAPASATSQTPLAAAAPKPPPYVTQLPGTTTRSSPPALYPVPATPKPSPPPTILPESPKQKLPSPSPPPKYFHAPQTVSQVQTSPPKPSPHQAATFNGPSKSSTSFPKSINSQPNTPSPSPNSRPILHLPSSVTLPPVQLKSDNIQEFNTPPELKQKTVTVHETKEKSKASPNIYLPRYTSESHNSIKPHKGEREASKNVHHKDKDKYKNTWDSDYGIRIVTLAGDNRGAIMELRPSRKKQEFGNNFHKIGNFRTWGEGEKTGSDNSSSEEGKSKNNKDGDRAITKEFSIPYVNSNVQGVNNSILFDATCSHHDPGVHISLSTTPARRGRGFNVKKHMTRDD